MKKLDALEDALEKAEEDEDILAHAKFCRDKVFAAMSQLRLSVDELETVIAKKDWPFPSYSDLLYSVL